MQASSLKEPLVTAADFSPGESADEHPYGTPPEGTPSLESSYWGFTNIADIPLGHPENLALLFGLYEEIAEVGEEGEGARLLRVELDLLLETPGLPSLGRRALHLHTRVFGSAPEPKDKALARSWPPTPMDRYDVPRIAQRLRARPDRVREALQRSFQVMAGAASSGASGRRGA